ncbi:hypothetical protein BC936DRAFT_148112 [Jimgerdemannia flammicorona]|uniref:Rab-GAP TBC domain-containing protein n=1 Tax=Jimgerdemannia flammicorona TaxID=994334 RepID=A0A433D3X2_9FUNG|nr:hypothetical protein BC936DRAFT_148112 [Jimgerdemannia flammicorona]
MVRGGDRVPIKKGRVQQTRAEPRASKARSVKEGSGTPSREAIPAAALTEVFKFQLIDKQSRLMRTATKRRPCPSHLQLRTSTLNATDSQRIDMGKQHHRTHRVKLIYEAAVNKDIEQLRRLARSEDGLSYDWLRRLAWPVLLHTWQGCYIRDKGSEQDLTDWKQISKDVQRSLYLFAGSVPQKLKTHKQKELHEMIVEILWRNPGLHYYQGFHDICTSFLLILGKKQAIPAAENVALFFLRYPFLNEREREYYWNFWGCGKDVGLGG